MTTLSQLSTTIQQYLFPMQEEVSGQLTDTHKLFVKIVEPANIGALIPPVHRGTTGRPPHSRLCIAYAFVAKAVWNCTTWASSGCFATLAMPPCQGLLKP